MNGIDRIKERILEDARLEGDKIINDARKKADDIRKESEAKAAAVNKKTSKDYETKAADIKRRMLSIAQLDMRKKVLEVKQEMIDKAFARCLESITSMSTEEYSSMLEDLLLRCVHTGEEEIVFSSRDANSLGPVLIDKVNGKLTALGRKGALRVSQEKGNFLGGFILKSRGIEINNSFESTLRIIREEIEPKIAEMLF